MRLSHADRSAVANDHSLISTSTNYAAAPKGYHISCLVDVAIFFDKYFNIDTVLCLVDFDLFLTDYLIINIIITNIITTSDLLHLKTPYHLILLI